MSATGTVVIAAETAPSDTELVAGVRAGEDAAFEELYRRYGRRITTFVHRLVRDEGRAEDVTQEAFFSALRRMRATDSEIAFKPWIYEIARNAAIDSWRRGSRAEEVSIDHDQALRPSDRGRLVGSTGPDSALIAKERMEHLRGALDELSETHHRVLVMRELEGLSYREIGERLDLTRPAVESTLFRARRRLEHEYGELETGRRCDAITHVIARMAEGMESDGDARRLARHARLCGRCRRRARQLGVEPLGLRRVARRAAALLPLPTLFRRRGAATGQAGAASGGHAGGAFGPFAGTVGELGVVVGERAAALAAAVALAGAGGAVLSGAGPFDGIVDSGGDRPGVEQRQAGGGDGGGDPARPTTAGETRAGGLAPWRAPDQASPGAREGRGGERGAPAPGRGPEPSQEPALSMPSAPAQPGVGLPALPPGLDAPPSGPSDPAGPDPGAPPPDAPQLEGPGFFEAPAPPQSPQAEAPADTGSLPPADGTLSSVTGSAAAVSVTGD